MSSESNLSDVVKALLQQYEAGEITRTTFETALSQVARGGSSVEARLGRWEYREFSVALTTLGEYEQSGWPVDGSIPFGGAIAPINAAVQAFVNTVAADGWEPTEPTDADRLYRARRIQTSQRQTLLHKLNSDSVYLVSPVSAMINCRRWTTK